MFKCIEETSNRMKCAGKTLKAAMSENAIGPTIRNTKQYHQLFIPTRGGCL